MRSRLSVPQADAAKARRPDSGHAGARGGAGATTLAVHLGCFLVGAVWQEDADSGRASPLGHVSLYLGEDEANYHFYELVQNIARLDESLLQGFVIHHSSCLDILPSPDCFDDSANVSLDDMQRAIRFLGQNYEYVVIDCPHGVHNLSLATIDCCDELYLIATPDVPALRDLSRCIDRFLQSNVPPDKIKVVINRYSSEGALSLEQIEKAIRQPIAITIPNASTDLIRAMNTGSPVLPDRKSGVRDPDEEVGGAPGAGRPGAGDGRAEAEVCVLELKSVSRRAEENSMAEAAFAFPDRSSPGCRPRRNPLLARAQQEVKSAVHRELIDKADLEKLLYMQDTRGRQQLLGLILQLVTEHGVPFSASERTRLANEVMDEVFGLGPLEPLLQDPTVTDILVNTSDTVYVERGGVLEEDQRRFQRQPSPDAHHRQDRLRGRPAGRRVVADGGRATAATARAST